MSKPRVVDTVKVGGRFRVSPDVIEDTEMWNWIFPTLKADMLDEMSKFGTVVESTLVWNIELPNPMEYGPDDSGWRSYPSIAFTAYVIQDNADA